MIHGLYAITDATLMRPKRFAAMLRQALEGGAQVVQYRDKSKQHEQRWRQAQLVVNLCKEYNAISIINDDIELAKIVNADGVHLGSEDGSIKEARKILNEKKIIGISCYADIQRCLKAEQQGADYIAVGTMYASSTKPENSLAGLNFLRTVKRQVSKPVVAIGGINVENATNVIEAGADGIAVISALFASDDIQNTAQEFSKLF